MATSESVECVLSDLPSERSKRELKDYSIFRDEYFLFSVFPYYDIPRNSKKKRERLIANGIHELTGCNGKILLDSGGFQLYKKNIALDYKETLEIYDKCKLRNKDFGISLDFCPFFSDDAETRMDKITRSNFIFKKMFDENHKVVPVIHGVTKKEFRESFKQINGNNFISYASNFPLITMTLSSDELLKKNSMSVKEQIIHRFMTFLELLREQKMDENRIHVLGATGQNSSHLCWFAGMDQTDSSSWRLKAVYGKIALLGVSEAKISKIKSTFGVNKWKDSHDKLLRECECPICSGNNLNERKRILGLPKTEGFRNRCVHNAFVYLQERNIARDMIGTPRYKYYLEDRFKGLWWYKFLKKVDDSRHQKDLDFYIKLN